MEIKGERARALVLPLPTQGMEVTTNSPRALTSQKMVLELLSDMPEQAPPWTQAQAVGATLGAEDQVFEKKEQPKADLSHPAIAVNRRIRTRCVRACRAVQVNDVIGYAGRGEHSKIVFDFDDPMGELTRACASGAVRGTDWRVMPARGVGLQKADKTVDSVCPFCG